MLKLDICGDGTSFLHVNFIERLLQTLCGLPTEAGIGGTTVRKVEEQQQVSE